MRAVERHCKDVELTVAPSRQQIKGNTRVVVFVKMLFEEASQVFGGNVFISYCLTLLPTGNSVCQQHIISWTCLAYAS
jgi:hypothetical protein